MRNKIIIWSLIFIAVVGVTIGGLYWLRTREAGPVVQIQQGVPNVRPSVVAPGGLTAEQKARQKELEAMRAKLPKDILTTWSAEDLQKENEKANAVRAEIDAASAQP